MATSGTHSFGLTVANVIDEGFERIGMDPSSLSAAHLNSALRSLNLVFREIENRESVEFLRDTVSLSFAAGEYAKALPAGTIDVLSVAVTSDGSDIPMGVISRNEWLDYPDKDQTGLPQVYFVDQQSPADTTLLPDLAATDTPALVIWPATDEARTINLWRIRSTQDAGGLSEDTDIRLTYQEAICAGMAHRLAQKYPGALPPGMSVAAYKAEFVDQLHIAASSERRSGEIMIAASYRNTRRRRL